MKWECLKKYILSENENVKIGQSGKIINLSATRENKKIKQWKPLTNSSFKSAPDKIKNFVVFGLSKMQFQCHKDFLCKGETSVHKGETYTNNSTSSQIECNFKYIQPENEMRLHKLKTYENT